MARVVRVTHLSVLLRLPAAVPALKAAAVGRHLPHAAVALAAFGSAETLEAAAEVKDLILPADLDTILGYWRDDAAAEQQWAWNPEVDGGAAVSFLQTLLREADDKDVRIAAANLMRETGERPDAQGLMMLAAGQGHSILIEVDGEEASKAIEALVALVEDGFGEED